MAVFVKPFYGATGGNPFPVDFKPGDFCPADLEPAARSAGVLDAEVEKQEKDEGKGKGK